MLTYDLVWGKQLLSHTHFVCLVGGAFTVGEPSRLTSKLSLI